MNTLSQYLSQLKKHPILTIEEEKSLFIQYNETQNKQILDKIISSNLRYVIFIAKKLKSPKYDILDLIQEGNAGLLYAATKFDHNRENRFITFANMHIQAKILEYITRNYDIVRFVTTKSKRKLFFNTNTVFDNNGRPNDILETSKKLGVDIKDVEEYITYKGFSSAHYQANLIQNDSRNDDISLSYLSDTRDTIESYIDDQHIKYAYKFCSTKLGTFTPMEQDIINSRYIVEDKPTRAVLAKKYQVSNQAIEQREKRVLSKLKLMCKEM